MEPDLLGVTNSRDSSGKNLQPQSQPSTVFDPPTSANRLSPRQRWYGPTSTNLGPNNHGGGSRPHSKLELLEAETNKTHQDSIKVSKAVLRQLFPGVDEAVLE